MADGDARLLARLGIVARIRQVEKAGYEPGYHVIVAGGPSLRAFCTQVEVHGETVRELEKFLADRATNTNVDTVPLGMLEIVKAERVRAGLTERQFQAAIGRLRRHRPRLIRAAPGSLVSIDLATRWPIDQIDEKRRRCD